MREIKFRAWDGTQMYTPIIGTNGELFRDYRDVEDFNSAPHDELMQYTGLKDKNGTEIYEDDIVVDTAKNTHLITFDEHSYFFHKIYDSWLEKDVFKRKQRSWLSGLFTKDFEVIGNIYENKELINHD